MPNWCLNMIMASHANPKKLQLLVDAHNADRMLDIMVPEPEYARDVTGETQSDILDVQDLAALGDAQMKLEKSRYAWRLGNWGCKWDVRRSKGDKDIAVEEGSATIWFHSPWLPPLRAYEILRDDGFSIQAYYFEPMTGFCGYADDQQQQYVDILEPTREWIGANVPSHIDEAMGVSQTYVNHP
jgi:hypothetical protein